MSGDSSRRPEPLEAQEVQRLQRELAAINECPEAPDDMQELVDSDDEDPGDGDTSSAAESFAAMARMSENYRKAAEMYSDEDIANLKDFEDNAKQERDEFYKIFRENPDPASPERQWSVLKQLAKSAEAESRAMLEAYEQHKMELLAQFIEDPATSAPSPPSAPEEPRIKRPAKSLARGHRHECRCCQTPSETPRDDVKKVAASDDSSKSMGSCWAFEAPRDKPTAAEQCCPRVRFGGFICPVFDKQQFAEDAEKIRATCMAERAAAEASQGLNNVRTLVEDKPVNQINEVATSHEGWQLLSMAVDSGAAETVIPHRLVTQHPIMPTRDSQTGLCYASATGQPIPNLGEQKLPLFTNEGTLRGMTFQAAPVSKPLGSVKRMCASGHRVVFDDDGSYIENKATGEINWLREEEGNYMLDAWIVPPHAMPPNETSSFQWQP